MIWCNNTFNYINTKGRFHTLHSTEEEDNQNTEEYVVDYDAEDGLYRVTNFLNGHWIGDVVFKEKRPDGFDLLARLGYLREDKTNMINLDDIIDTVANWLLENNLIDEVDY